MELYKRLSTKYALGWAALDNWQYLGDVREGDVKNDCFSITLPPALQRLPTAYLLSAVSDTVSSSCRCEHDCCGHTTTTVDAVRVCRTKIKVRLHCEANV